MPVAGGSAGQEEHRPPQPGHFTARRWCPTTGVTRTISALCAAPPLPGTRNGPTSTPASPLMGTTASTARPPPVFGTELRPTEPPWQEPEETERDNGIEIAPRRWKAAGGADAGAENAIPDDTRWAESRPSPTACPTGMGSKAHDRPSFFAQPGILAAVVGGAVVGLLCAILLVYADRLPDAEEGRGLVRWTSRSDPTGNSYSKNYNKEFTRKRAP